MYVNPIVEFEFARTLIRTGCVTINVCVPRFFVNWSTNSFYFNEILLKFWGHKPQLMEQKNERIESFYIEKILI